MEIPQIKPLEERSIKVGILRFGISNLGSLVEAFRRVGQRTELVTKPEELAVFDRLVLPGVGTFCEGMAVLKKRRLLAPLQGFAKEGRPLLGICLGMQMLFEKSHEQGEHLGLGILRGEVNKLEVPRPEFRVPHMGWADVVPTTAGHKMFGRRSRAFYFLHSYVAEPQDSWVTAATFDFGKKCAAAVSQGPILGVQFHPEKSGDAGLDLLKNFVS